MIVGMFLRRNRREVNGETYEYWTLVESYRTERGPRQRVVATLGKLGGLDQEERHGWEELEWLLEGQRPPRQLKLGSDEQTLGVSGPLWAEVDLSGVRVERVRDFGEVYLALFAMEASGFGRTAGRTDRSGTRGGRMGTGGLSTDFGAL